MKNLLMKKLVKVLSQRIIITIIVLIIIAGISIATLAGDNGVLKQTSTSKVTQIERTAMEQVELACSAVKLAIEEAAAKDSSYSAVDNSSKIQNVLLDVLNKDIAGLNGNFKHLGDNPAANGVNKIGIVYDGDDYKNATNNVDAKIAYTISLEKKTIELSNAQNTLDDIEPGLYESGSNYAVLLKTWDELVADGAIHVNDGVVTTNYDFDNKINNSSSMLSGELAISESVKEIGFCAFIRCAGLTGIRMAENIISIGENAFQNCEGLVSVNIPGSVKNIGQLAFAYCSSLKNIIISEGVENIGIAAFGYCTNLNSITVPSSVKNMEKQTFYRCTNLTSVELSEGIKNIPQSMFYECENLRNLKIPESVIEIEKWAFRGCTSFKSVGSSGSGASLEIPYTIKKLGMYVFQNCTNLESVDLPKGVISIDECAFANCINITSIKLPSTVTTIGNYAFHTCENITNMVIPKNVANIGESIFYNCKNLRSIEVEEENTKYYSEGNCVIEDVTNTLVIGCASSIIPKDGSVTNIGNRAFYGCVSLTNIEIPETITSIGNVAFGNCESLTSINIPASVTNIPHNPFYGCLAATRINVAEGNTKYHSEGNCIIETDSKTLVIGCANSIIPTDGSVTSIGQAAFANYTNLINITIPDTVISVGIYVFNKCTNLESITIPTSVTSIGRYVFGECSKLKIIKYLGTQAQWENVTKEENWDINAGAFTIEYSK